MRSPESIRPGDVVDQVCDRAKAAVPSESSCTEEELRVRGAAEQLVRATRMELRQSSRMKPHNIHTKSFSDEKLLGTALLKL